MNNQQITALRCAYADLQGVLQSDKDEGGTLGQYINIQTIELTLAELEDTFPFLANDD